MRLFITSRYWLTGLLMTLAIVAACEKKSELSQVEQVAENEPDQQFVHAQIVITENGMTSAIVRAESVRVYTETDYTAVDGGMVIDFFNQRGTRTSTLSADRGEVFGLYEEVDSLKAQGRVVILSDDRTKKMETSKSLWWRASERTIYADGHTRLISEDAVEEGVHFVAKDDLSEYTMDNVSGSFEGETLPLPGESHEKE